MAFTAGSGCRLSIGDTPKSNFGKSDTSVRMWNVETGEQEFIFGGEEGGHEAPVMSLAISPDGKWAVTGDTSGVLILWNIDDGTEVRRMESPGDWVSRSKYAPWRMSLSG